MINNLLNMFFPETCPVCMRPALDHATAPICAECWNSICRYTGPACQKCGKPLVSEASTTCGGCLQDEPAFVYARSFGLYDHALRKAINLLKYHNVRRLSRPLSDILLRMNIPPADVVIPVPLHEKRLKQREFNQSALFGKYVAQRLDLTLTLNCLVKLRNTAQQVGLSSQDRNKNIRKAFRVNHAELIKGKDILLIDDVITTGATVRECSYVLKKAGAGNIYVIALAHGVMD